MLDTHLPGDVPGEVAVGGELQLAFILRLVVNDLYFTRLGKRHRTTVRGLARRQTSRQLQRGREPTPVTASPLAAATMPAPQPASSRTKPTHTSPPSPRSGWAHHVGAVATDLVNPELAHNDVVNGGGDFPPDVVIAAGVELQVDGACRERGAWSSARVEGRASNPLT